MADNDEVEVVEEVVEDSEVDESEEVIEDLEESTDDNELDEIKGENTILRTLLGHFAKDLDVDEEMENIAWKKDGTPVYIGDTQVGTEESTPVKRRKKPAETRGSSGKQKFDTAGLIAQARKLNAGG